MKLRELYLCESAKTAADLGPYVVDLSENSIEIVHEKVVRYWSDPTNLDPATRQPLQLDAPDRLATADLEDHNGYWTIHPNATSGWGPLIYEIGIEYATLHGKGMVPASGISSLYGYHMADTPASTAVWRRFYERSDVQHTLLIDRQPPWLYCLYTRPPITFTQLKFNDKLA